MLSSLPRCHRLSALAIAGTLYCLEYAQASEPIMLMAPLLAMVVAMQICDASNAASVVRTFRNWTLVCTC